MKVREATMWLSTTPARATAPGLAPQRARNARSSSTVMPSSSGPKPKNSDSVLMARRYSIRLDASSGSTLRMVTTRPSRRTRSDCSMNAIWAQRLQERA